MEFYNIGIVKCEDQPNTLHIRTKRFHLARILILASLLLCAFMLGTFMNVFANNDQTDVSVMLETVQASDENILRTVDVQTGDTLWSIAKSHAPEHVDVRYYVEQMVQLNELHDYVIHADQLLYLP